MDGELFCPLLDTLFQFPIDSFQFFFRIDTFRDVDRIDADRSKFWNGIDRFQKNDFADRDFAGELSIFVLLEFFQNSIDVGRNKKIKISS